MSFSTRAEDLIKGDLSFNPERATRRKDFCQFVKSICLFWHRKAIWESHQPRFKLRIGLNKFEGQFGGWGKTRGNP